MTEKEEWGKNPLVNVASIPASATRPLGALELLT